MFTRPKDKTILSFLAPLQWPWQGCCCNLPRVCNAVRRSCVPPPPYRHYRHYRHCPPPPPTIRLCSLRSAGLVKRVWPAPDQWLRDQMAACWAGFTSPVAMSCAFVLLRCFSCSHTVLPKEHSLGVFFFSSLSSCKCCIFLQFYLHFTTDYTCMIVYVTNNKNLNHSL